MGLYWTTILYLGRMLSPEAYARIAKVWDADTERFITKVAPDRWLLHEPVKMIKMDSTDFVLEYKEKEQGFVSRQEVDQWLEARPTYKKQWESGLERDSIRLKELVTIAAGCDTDDEKPGLYVCEFSWTPGHDAHVTYNLRVQ